MQYDVMFNVHPWSGIMFRCLTFFAVHRKELHKHQNFSYALDTSLPCRHKASRVVPRGQKPGNRKKTLDSHLFNTEFDFDGLCWLYVFALCFQIVIFSNQSYWMLALMFVWLICMFWCEQDAEISGNSAFRWRAVPI